MREKTFKLVEGQASMLHLSNYKIEREDLSILTLHRDVVAESQLKVGGVGQVSYQLSGV